MSWYKLITPPLFSIISFCNFLLNIAWHYYWYRGPYVKEKNPELYDVCKRKSILTVIKESWFWRNEEV